MKILLVRLRQIGDVVFTTPAIRGLRQHFPDAQLTYLVEAAAAPIVQGHPLLDEVLVVGRARGWSGWRQDLALGRQLRDRHFDLAIDFHGGPRASLLTWLSRAPTRIGYAVVGRHWMYTRVVDRPRELRPRHSVENQWDLLRPLGIAPPTPEDFPVEMTRQPGADALVEARLARAGVPANARLIVMHVSAGNPFRRWPIASFGEVAATLVEREDTRWVIFTSGPSESAAASLAAVDGRARLPADVRERIIAWGDDFSLSELRSLTDRAALYVGGDSGPMHVASTSHVPMVSLYGPTLPARSAPWRSREWPARAVEVANLPCRPCDQRVCAPGDFRCLAWTAPSTVVEAAEELLGRRAKIEES